MGQQMASRRHPRGATPDSAAPREIAQDEISITDLTHRQSQIQEQIRQLQGRVQASPMVEQQFKELTS